MNLNAQYITGIVQRALAEDIGAGDITTLSTVSEAARSTGEIVSKEPGIIAGLACVREVYRQVDEAIHVEDVIRDGDRVATGDRLVRVRGPVRGILTAERTALNFLQRLSGIATNTHRFVEAVAGTAATILDTRKTTPGLRLAEKYAVAAGGGSNHRIGLFDMILIKENHILAAGGIRQAVEVCRAADPQAKVEVEVSTSQDVEEALKAGADRIMLDNMTPEEMKREVTAIRSQSPGKQTIEIEASGGIDLQSVRQVAETGVDFISVGGLTHSSPSLDVAFYLREGS